MLKTLHYDCEYIYSGYDDQQRVAQRWNNDELKVLISTTIGLVGNESTKTQMVCIVGLLYNIPSVIQSIGRIRPMRRNSSSICSIFTPVNNTVALERCNTDSKSRFEELVGANILSRELENKYFRSMTTSSVYDWLFNDKGCRLVSLSTRLGYKKMSNCTVCDQCKDTSISKSSEIIIKELDECKKRKHEGIQLLRRMKLKCIVCDKEDCRGNCVVKGMKCYHCLEGHKSKACPKLHLSQLEGKLCYSCYVYNYSGAKNHTYLECSTKGEIRERLRGLIQFHYLNRRKGKEKKLKFKEYMAGIYVSEEAFFKFLSNYTSWQRCE